MRSPKVLDIRSSTGEGHPLPWFVLRAIDRLAEVNRDALSAAAVALGFLIAVADYVTGADVDFTVLYLALVALAGVVDSRRARRRIALLAIGLSFVGDLSIDRYPSLGITVGNAIAQILIFCLVVSLVAALRNAMLRERWLSRTDALTGLANSRCFLERAEIELRRMRRTAAPLTIAYLDVDNFKQVNDEAGHAAGDNVLAAIGDALRASLREVDCVARLGGDEFGVLIPEAPRAHSEVAIRRIYSILTDLAASQDWPVGFSIGAVTFTAPAEAVDDLLERADELMYEAKHTTKGGIRFGTASLPLGAAETTP